jgi:hypothetical protein
MRRCLVRALALLACASFPVVARAQANIVGVVYDSLATRAALAEAQVTIIELNRVAWSDKRGRFRFDTVKAGKYTITFSHPVLDSLDVSAPEVLLDVPAMGTVVAALATPSPATTYARLCPGPREQKTGVVFGRVHAATDRSSAVGVRVFGNWVDMLLVGTRLKREWRETGVLTGKRGEFILCGVPTDVAVDIRATRGVLAAGPVQVQSGDQLISHIDFTVPVADSGARMLAGDSGRALRADSAAPNGTSVLNGTVKGEDGRPVADALVGLLGFNVSARTSPTGQFALARAPAGTRTVQVRALGTAPKNVVIDLPENGRAETIITLDKRPVQLASVAVTGARDTRDVPHATTGFASRQKAGLGKYLTGDDIKKFTPWTLVDALAMVTGVRREWSASGPSITIRGSKGQCIPSIFLDGMSVATGERGDIPELEGLIKPEAINGIEVYPGPFIPPQFDRSAQTGCGSVAIWTRR